MRLSNNTVFVKRFAIKKRQIFAVVIGLNIVFGIAFTSLHKYYVSVSQIEYVEKQATLQIISRFFRADIEKALKQRYDALRDQDLVKNPVLLDQYLKQYFEQKMHFTINSRHFDFDFLGKEYDNDLMICYFEIPNVKQLQVLKISNLALMDVFEEQQHIVHVKYRSTRKSVVLVKERSEIMLKFN